MNTVRPKQQNTLQSTALATMPAMHPAVRPLMEPLHWAGQQVLVLGSGESGQAMVAWLLRCGAKVKLADTRNNPPGAAKLLEDYPQLTSCFGHPQQSWLDDIDLVAWSPGVSIEQGSGAALAQWAQARGIPVAGEIEWFAQALARLRQRGYQPALVAVTGTNGKTTTVSLLAKLCETANRRVALAGNVSPAALRALIDALDFAGLNADEWHRDTPLSETIINALPQVWVLELSSFQLALCTSLQADASALLNLSEDHLDWHASMDHYAAAKQQVFQALGIAVYSRDDPATEPKSRAVVKRVGFGRSLPQKLGDFGVAQLQGLQWLVEAVALEESGGRKRRMEPAPFRLRPLMPADALRVRGHHNQANALAALALGRAIGLPMAAMLHGLRRFEAGPHRCEILRVINDVAYIDDSKGTNVGATVAALQGLGMPCHLIAGGVGKGQDFAALGMAIVEHASSVALIGEAADAIEAAIRHALAASPLRLAKGLEISRHSCLQAAVQAASQAATTGEAVLLSPACASFDMFRDYKHRAAMFARAIDELNGVIA